MEDGKQVDDELVELLDRVKPGYGQYAPIFHELGYHGAPLSVCCVKALALGAPLQRS